MTSQDVVRTRSQHGGLYIILLPCELAVACRLVRLASGIAPSRSRFRVRAGRLINSIVWRMGLPVQIAINATTCTNKQTCPGKTRYHQEVKTYKNDALADLARSHAGKP